MAALANGRAPEPCLSKTSYARPHDSMIAARLLYSVCELL